MPDRNTNDDGVFSLQDRGLADRLAVQALDRQELLRFQLSKLNTLLSRVLPENRFYRERFGKELYIRSIDEWTALPLVSKQDLVSDGDSDLARNHTYAPQHYTRLHRTSGTRGRPMIVLDSSEDWQWWLDTWQFVWDAARVRSTDTVFMAFSFGPFIGFWSAFEAATQRGLKAVPGGGLSTLARLDLIRASQSNVLCCTPTYAIHLAEAASEHGIDIKQLGIETIVVAGEPGGSVPAIRGCIEQAWEANVIDHAGATEVGPWGFGDPNGQDLRVIESEFLAEFLPMDQQCRLAHNDELVSVYELVLTSLGRVGVPALRYRTGDVVCPDLSPGDGSNFLRLRGGILGRADDMLIVRGVNVFPTSIESILRSIPTIHEYRMIADKDGAMDQLTIEVEDTEANTQRVVDAFAIQLGLRVNVIAKPVGSLPRFEGKARRFIDRRKDCNLPN